ncbi:hypothetical protein Asch03_01744 [Acinetobacter schindleri]
MIFFLNRLIFLTLTIIFLQSTVYAESRTINMEKVSAAVAKGDVEVIHFMGNSYFEGLYGNPKDYHKAFEWYEKSAKLGYTKSQIAVADMYFNGFGTDKNPAKGVE